MNNKNFLKWIVISLCFISSIISEKKYTLNYHFYFDPITNNKCDHTNYWTPFNQNTTCFRWIMLNANDTEEDTTLPLILDHNMFVDTFANINTSLKILKAKWTRYRGKVDIPDKETIFKLNLFEKEPTLEKKTVSPYFKIGELVMNSYWRIDGKIHDEGGYWLNKTFDEDPSYAYVFTTLGDGSLVNVNQKIGIRPTIEMKKSELTSVIPDAVNIDGLIAKSKLYQYPFEDVKHGGQIYKQLQSFTVTEDNLVWTASNGNNPDYCVIYSYKGENFSECNKILYDKCGHGNGIAWLRHTDKLLVCGPTGYKEVFQYNRADLKFEASLKKSEGYPQFNGIGYNYEKDLILGYSFREIFLSKNQPTFEMVYAFNYPMFETTQDITWYDGYIFMPCFDAGKKTIYQIYNFWGPSVSVIYIYDAHLDEDGKAGKDFGRLVSRVIVHDKGEIEGISFQHGKVYFGYAAQSIDKVNVYKFYEMEYQTFKDAFLGAKQFEIK